MAVTIDEGATPLGDPHPGIGTPLGLAALKDSPANVGLKVKGTDAAEKGRMTDLLKDSDDVIDMGGGDDVFVFSQADTVGTDLNGIVKMGEGFDSAYMAFQITDYEFTLRSDGGIKIRYIGDNSVEAGGKGDAVTFYGTEQFVFRNIDDQDGTNYRPATYDYDALVALVNLNGG